MQRVFAPTTQKKIMHGIDSDVDSDSELGEDERAASLALTMQRLGNMSRKPINKIATVDPYVSGRMLLEKTIRKARLTLLRRRQRILELLYNLMKYFSAQMAKRNEQLPSFYGTFSRPNSGIYCTV